MTFKHKLKLLLPLLIFGVFYILVFAYLESLDRTYGIVPSFGIDHMIPFIPVFVIPYVLWFIWVPFVALLLLISDEKNFIMMRRYLMIGMTIFLTFSAVLPTELFLRPDDVEVGGICGYLLKFIYSNDTATNVFPSIHVYNSLVTWHAVETSDEVLFRDHRFRVFTSVQAILIILSTMFVKQHSVIDVAGAFLMFGIVIFADKMMAGRSGSDNSTGSDRQ